MTKLDVLLSIVLVSTVVLTGLSCSEGTPPSSVIQTSEIQKPSGESSFSMTTTTEDGLTVHATAEPNMLTFLMEGNIVPNRWLPMLGVWIYYNELTQEQIEQKEVALQLLEHSGNFIDPRDIQLKTSSRSATARIRFICVGEKDGSRQIGLNAQLKDASGNVLVTENRICNCNFGGGPIHHGTLTFDILPENWEHFDFPLRLVKDVKQISITLKEL